MGLVLRSSHTTKRVINKLCKLYDSVSYQLIKNILKEYAKENGTLMKEWADQEVVQCGDNLDVRSSVRFEGNGQSYHDIHMYNNIIYKSPIPTSELSDDIPEVDISQISYDQFLFNTEEEEEFLGALRYVVMESWQGHVQKSILPTPPANKYAELMNSRTEKVSAHTLYYGYYIAC